MSAEGSAAITCVVEARGRMRTVLVRFLDTGERVTTSARAIRHA